MGKKTPNRLPDPNWILNPEKGRLRPNPSIFTDLKQGKMSGFGGKVFNGVISGEKKKYHLCR